MPNWRKELRDLARRDPVIGSETVALSNAIHDTESDRGCALIAGSITENSLEQILRTRLIPLGKEKMDELFGFDGPLGTFSSKIKIAYAFGLIDVKIRDDLDRVREIRNTFAHSKVAVEFATPEISRACAGFVHALPEILKEQVKGNPRQAYITTVMTLTHVATLAMEFLTSGRQRRESQPLSYDVAVALRGKFLQQLLQQSLESSLGW